MIEELTNGRLALCPFRHLEPTAVGELQLDARPPVSLHERGPRPAQRRDRPW